MATRHTATAKQRISIHALREEGDPLISRAGFMAWVFQSTPSARRATLYDLLKAAFDKFQSTPSARRATSVLLPVCWACSYFNPRPPRGGRQRLCTSGSSTQRFQSTPSARRATLPRASRAAGREISIHALREESDWFPGFHFRIRAHFNPRPPRGERQFLPLNESCSTDISIHALREESDSCVTPFNYRGTLFQSTPSARRATRFPAALPAVARNFNPRPPRGERLSVTVALVTLLVFQSTPSARRATIYQRVQHHFVHISIHALREESDRVHLSHGHHYQPISIHALREESDIFVVHLLVLPDDFNPRPPRGERHSTGWIARRHFLISIHALREESDLLIVQGRKLGQLISIHALREESDG